MEKRSIAVFAMLASAFCVREGHELLLASEGVEQYFRVGGDVVVLGRANQRRAGDLAREPFERIVASHFKVVERSRYVVNQHSAPQSPSARRMAEHRIEYASQDRGSKRALPGQSSPQKSRHPIPGGFEQRVLTRIRDQCGEARLSAGAARREIAAETESHQRDSIGVDVGARDQVIDHRANDIFPIRPEVKSLFDERRTLAGAVEGDAIVATPYRRSCVEKVQLLRGAVVATGENDRARWPAVGVRTIEVAR